METIEILTQIIRHQNEEPAKPIIQLNDSKAVTDSLRDYLDSLNKVVVNVVNENSDQEDEVSIKETITLKPKG